MLYLWISAINLMGIALGSAVSTNLLSRILLNQNNTTEWFKVLTSLAICGAAQGFILAGSQTVVLKPLDATPKVVQCFWTKDGGAIFVDQDSEVDQAAISSF
jgi:hypothetical protein